MPKKSCESAELFSLQNTVIPKLDETSEDDLCRLLKELFCDYIENEEEEISPHE